MHHSARLQAPSFEAPSPSSAEAGGSDGRSLRIERIRAEISEGTYETQARLDAATDRLLDKLSR